ncbi:MAG: phage/plasmid primase, P4 family [Gemmatimonadales bacterium]
MSAAGEHTTDTGNCRRLVRQFGDRFRYDGDRRCFFVYDGRRWVEDLLGKMERFAKATALSIYEEAAACPEAELKRSLARWAAASESARAIAAMLKLAQSEPGVAIRATAFDSDPWLFNVENGTLDLRAKALRPHDAADLITKLAPVAYDPTATCPQFLAFLDRVFSGDGGLIGFLQRYVGYSLTGLTREHVLALLYGVGRNGKSTLLELLALLLGDYGARAEFGTFLLKRHNEGPRNDLAALVGSRLVIGSEAGEEARWDEARVKEITGGDTITCRRLYSELFSYRPTFKVWLGTNNKPQIRSTGEAIWSRLRLIPFDVVIPEAERDPELLEKLAGELPGILAWAVAGCAAWQRDGLGQPPAVRSATAAYRDESDLVGPFLDQECEQAAQFSVPAGWLYKAFREWVERNGETPISQQAFGKRLSEKGFQRVRSTGGRRMWHGLRLGVTLVTDQDPVFGKVPYEERVEEVTGSDPRKASPASLDPDDEARAAQREGA